MLPNLTKTQAKRLAKDAAQITRSEHDGELRERTVTYDEMLAELSLYSRWGAQHDTEKKLIFISSSAHIAFTVQLAPTTDASQPHTEPQ